MASAVPAGVYGRRVPAGGIPIPAALEPEAAFRITMAAIDPSAEPELDEDNKVPRATLKIIRIPFDLEEDDDEDYDDDEEDDEDYDSEDIEALAARLREGGALPELDSDMSEDDDSATEKNGGPSDPAKSKKVKQEALSKKIQEELDAEEMELDHLTNGVNGKGKAKATADDSDEDDDEDEDDFDDDEPEEFVLCTLDPEKHYQQPLDITVREGEEVYLVVEGTHDVFVTGNYVAFPNMNDDDEEDGLDELGYDLSPDEDELDMEDMSEDEDDELDGLEDPRIIEVDSDEEAPKLVTTGKKGKNKRTADSDEDEAATLDELINKTKAEVANSEKLSKKQAKKLKKNDGQAAAAAQEPAKKDDKKKVQFAKNLEQGPTGSPKVEEKKEAKKETPKQRTVSGVTIEDKKEGKGRAAKKGDRIEMRYIGKLKNGKQFDANKKGKPFSFKLGVGEVIKGWDIGVAGMMPGSERRLVIPSNLAYGKKALPDIPANSDLVFDIKCISVS